MVAKRESMAILVILALVTLGFATQSGTITPAGASSLGRHLGFWMQEGNPMTTYTPQQFFDQYFLTSPYPSSLEVMVFGPQNGAAAEQASINYWTQVAALTDKYPAIEMEFMIAYDMSSQTADLQNYVNAFKSHPSVYSVGVEGEYATNQNLANMQTAMNIITSSGKQFVNYYVGASIVPSGGYIIGHTNFPGGDSGGSDQVGTLSLYQSSPYIGEDSGYYATFSFPGSLTCPIGASASSSSTWQWNQCVVDTIISTSLTISSQYRQFVNLVAGFPSPLFSTFTDSGGIKTSQLWDNPTLRSWIWNNPSYSANFVLSTAPSSSSSSTSSSSTSSSSTSSTSSASSPSISSSTITDSSTSSSILSTTLQTSSTSFSATTSSSSQNSTSQTTSGGVTSSLVTTSNGQSTSTATSQSPIAQALAPSSSQVVSNKNAMTYGFAGYEIALICGLPLITRTFRKNEIDAASSAMAWRW